MKKSIIRRAGSAVLALALLAGGAVTVLPSVVPEMNTAVKAYGDELEIRNNNGELWYKCRVLSDNTIEITKHYDIEEKVVIPSKVNGKTVSKIGYTAFNENLYNMKEVVIPEGVKTIDDMAFSHCENLKRVSIPNTVTSIGKAAFEYTHIEKLVIPDSVTNLGKGAFQGIYDLTEIKFGKGLKELRTDMIYGCSTKLKKATIPSTVKKISEDMFIDISVFDPKTLTIYCESGSVAESFAKRKGFTCVTYAEAQSVRLNKTAVTLFKGTSQTLTASVSPSNAIDKSITWTSSNSNVATVLNGKITAKNKGTATITAKTSNGKTANCKVTVKSAVSLNITSVSIGKGENCKLTATVDSSISNKAVAWRTSSPKIATVDKNGNVKAVGIGKAWITAKASNGVEQACVVNVKKAPTWVGISQSNITLGVGETCTLSASVAKDAAAAKRTYRSSNSGIVQMTKTNWTGSFKAVKPGTAWVTVRLYNGLEKSCRITVKKAPTWVGLNKSSITLKVGQTGSVNAYIASDAGCATRTYRTSNSSIVKMTRTNGTGEFKAMKKGVAWVTVRTYNGKEKSCKITVV